MLVNLPNHRPSSNTQHSTVVFVGGVCVGGGHQTLCFWFAVETHGLLLLPEQDGFKGKRLAAFTIISKSSCILVMIDGYTTQTHSDEE